MHMKVPTNNTVANNKNENKWHKHGVGGGVYKKYIKNKKHSLQIQKKKNQRFWSQKRNIYTSVFLLLMHKKEFYTEIFLLNEQKKKTSCKKLLPL